MPSTPWTALSTAAPTGLETLGTTLAGGLSALRTSLTTVQTQARIAKLTATDPRTNAVKLANLAIKAAVSAASAIVDGLLDSTGAYFLTIPMPKKGMITIEEEDSPDQAGTNYVVTPTIPLLSYLPAVEQASLKELPIVNQLWQADNKVLGGNAYFLKTILTALHDPGDSSRPKLLPTDTFAYAMIIVGAEDVFTILPAIGVLDKLFGGRSSLPAARGVTSFIPTNVRASMNPRQRTATVEWDLIPPSRVLTSYDETKVIPVELAILKSKDFRFTTATKVADLFGGSTLAAGDRGRYGTTVAAVLPYDGVRTRWSDISELTIGDDMFYRVAFRTRIVSPNQDTKELGYDQMSPSSGVRPSETVRGKPTRGVPPDWVRTPSLAASCPAIEEVLDNAREQLRVLASTTRSVDDQFDGYIAALESQIARFAQKVEDAEYFTKLINQTLAIPNDTAAIGIKMGTGTGGTAELAAQLMRDFSEYSDPNRPQFDAGTEYVCGAILLAGGPDPSAVAKQFDFLKALFGGATSSPTTGIPELEATIVAASDAVAAAEAALSFTAGMETTTGPDAACSTPITATPTFDSGMNKIG